MKRLKEGKLILRPSAAGTLALILALGSWTLQAAAQEPAPQPAPEESQLTAEGQEVDSEASAEGSSKDQQRIDSTAKAFDVPSGTVSGLREDKNRGWGEITIELSMAQHLSKTDPAAYPATSDALDKVESLRAEDKGWGAIAKELGFKLGPVVSGVKRAHKEIKTETAKPAAGTETKGSAAGKGQSEGKGRLEKGPGFERSGHPERPERAFHPEKHGRVDR